MSEANSGQRADWNGDSGRRWVADAERRDRVLKPVQDALLSAARIGEAEDVLDVGCGCGAVTLAAAELTTGKVTGVDLSEPMLTAARQRAGEPGQVAFIEADAQTCDYSLTVDLVISRFGTMFFDDPAAAFANIRRAVREDGRLCVATWQPLAANEWLSVPGAVLRRYAELPLPDPPGPGMFSQSDPEAVAAVLAAAGWHDASVAALRVDLRVGTDPADAADYLAATGPARRVLATLDPGRRSAALAAVTRAMNDHVSDGVQLKAGINIIRAVA
ncbi:MAG TPA: class I SAM-dependent methyltransferase [Streptosporangiaceae bacterium]|nr:class I SAM-dependent methyltransferase [Streptosporangiaceae bacterium]